MNIKWNAMALVLGGVVANSAFADRPQTVGTSTTTFSYTTTSGDVAFTGNRDYSGTGPTDATQLDTAPNIRHFNSANMFGRRTFVFNSGPQFEQVLPETESLIAHAFFKVDNANDYFPDITSDSTITIEVANLTFDRPVNIDPSTVMLHTLWADPQVFQLSSPYFSLHGHKVPSSEFRNIGDFQTTGVFTDVPTPNYVLNSSEVDVEITGQGTTTLRVTATFPYSAFEHLEESGQSVPGSLPAPHGFLEPFHFHVEFVAQDGAAVPAASTWGLIAMTLAMLSAGTMAFMGRRRLANWTTEVR